MTRATDRSTTAATRPATVISNLEYVAIGGVRTHTHAIVVRDVAYPPAEGQYRMLGFGTSTITSTFDVDVPSGEFQLTDAVSPLIMVDGENGGIRPLFRGAILRIPGWSQELHLIADVNSTSPIDVTRVDLEVSRLWRLVDRKIAEHWSAPYLPIPITRPTEIVRRDLAALDEDDGPATSSPRRQRGTVSR